MCILRKKEPAKGADKVSPYVIGFEVMDVVVQNISILIFF